MPMSSPPFGPLRRYEIRGLFGSQDHRFRLASDGPTLLTGSNGTGKSTVLRTIDSIGAGRWMDFYTLPFTSLRLDFEAATLKISHRSNRIRVQLNKDEPWEIRPEVVSPEIRRRTEYMVMRDLEGGFPAAGVPYGGEIFFDPASLAGRIALDEWLDQTPVPAWAAEIPDRFPVLFVTDQRLMLQGRGPGGPRDVRRLGRQTRYDRDTELSVRLAVTEFASDLSAEISAGLRRYAASSQALDRAFREKAVHSIGPGQRATSRDELDELEHEVESRRRALEAVDLLEPTPSPEPVRDTQLSDARTRSLVRAIAEDTLRKFDALEDLRKRLDAFAVFLNRRYQGKQVAVSRQKGFKIVLEGGSEINASRLSSGEQQLLVLAYQVLFPVKPGTLVLIDEPEISLHVLWQDSFVDDLYAMGQSNGLTFILATHSPTIVGGRRRLKRSLDRV